MPYVDGFVVPVPKKKLSASRRMAKKTGTIWREHRALEFRECVADDVKVGKLRRSPGTSSSSPAKLWCSPESYTSRARTATASTPR